MSTSTTNYYNWVFPNSDEIFSSSNAQLKSIATVLDEKLYFLERPVLKEGWADYYSPNDKEIILLDSSVENYTINLPDTPINGFYVDFLDIDGTADTLGISVETSGSDTIMNSSEGMNIDSIFSRFRLIYIESKTDWRIM